MKFILGPLAAIPLLIAGCADVNTVVNQGRSAFAGVSADTSDVCFAERQRMEDEGSGFIDVSASLGDTTSTLGQVLNEVAPLASVLGLGGASTTISAAQQANQIAKAALSFMDQTNQSLRDDNARIDRVVAAFNTLQTCRKSSASQIRGAYKAGTLPRADAEAQMADVRAANRSDVQRFRDIVLRIDRNAGAYAEIYNDVAEDNGGDFLEVGPYRRGQTATRTTRKRSKPRKTPKGTLKADVPAAKPKTQEMRTEVLTNVRKRDEAFARVEEAEDAEGDIDLALAETPIREA